MKLTGKIKELTALTSAICMLSVPAATTALATTGTKISSVPLSIESEIQAGDTDSDVTVSTSSSKFDVDDVVVTNEPSDEWDDGDKPKLKITLYADDDYYFASGFSKSSVSLSGSDGTVTSVSRSSGDTLIVYVTLDALDDDSDYDLDVSGLEWDESTGTASWEESSDAKKYEVRLYRGSSAVTSVLTTTSTSYDFSSYITKSGDYTFKVRGVYNTSNKGSWEESGSWYVSSSEAQEISSSSSSGSSSSSDSTTASSDTGAWLKDDVGWWYCNADHSYTTNGWQYINNLWYYFDENGYMKTGWILYKDAWYYCGESGAMLVNTTTPDGYYVNGDGVWVQ